MDFIGLTNSEIEWRNDFQERALREVAKAKGMAPDVAYFDTTQIASFLKTKDSGSRACSTLLPLKNRIYRPLRDTQCIRVLDLQPSDTFPSPLCCSLRSVSVEFEYPSIKDPGYANVERRRETTHAVDLVTGRPVWYTALSYLWGPPDFSCEVWIYTEVAQIHDNGSNDDPAPLGEPLRHAITSNLDAAMRHLRDAKDTVTLWIDQICINQSDNTEKADQIALMSLVYRRAMNTSIWLGPDPDHLGEASTGAFEILRAIQDAFNFTPDVNDQRVFETVDLPCSRREAYKSLAMLFRRPWFSRVWIIQEAILSLRRVVRCGQGIHKRAIDWEDFGAASMTTFSSGILDWLRTEATTEAGMSDRRAMPVEEVTVDDDDWVELSRGAAIASELNATSVTLTFQLNGPAPMPWSLLLMLADTRYADATNPRDKIYGVLALVSEKIVADYTLSTGEVYHKAMLTAINYGAVLNHRMLLKTFCAVDHDPVSGAPSWIPDWSKPRVTGPLGSSTMILSVYSAGSGFLNAHQPQILNDGKTVEISGQFVDVIDSLTEIWIDSVELAPEKGLTTPLTKVEAFMNQYEIQKASNEDNFDVLWKTLVAGKDAAGREECPQSYREVFDKVMHPSMLSRGISVPTDDSAPNRSHRKAKSKPSKERSNRAGRLRAWERLLPDVQSACNGAVKNRRVCITQRRRLGLVPGRVEKTDVVAIFADFPVPFVIRPRSDSSYQLIGECYVHGLMKGQPFESDRTVQPIRIS